MATITTYTVVCANSTEYADLKNNLTNNIIPNVSSWTEDLNTLTIVITSTATVVV